eukprot:scaffold116816_cov42-Cyclotella_meneghiniana.AAC.1
MFQELLLYATGCENIDEYFYLTYCRQQTRLMSVDVTADDLEDAIKSDISSIPAVSVEDERDYPLEGKSWTIHLQDEEAELFFRGMIFDKRRLHCQLKFWIHGVKR